MLRIVLPIVILLGSIAGTFALISNRPAPPQEEVSESAILVEVMLPRYEDAFINVRSQGTVEPRTQTSIVSEVAGRIIEVSPAFVVGGFFQQGDVLLKIDDQNYRAAVSRDQASVASAYSLLEQERGQADVAQREWNRMTETQHSQVRAPDLYLRIPQLQEAEARLVSAQADLEKSQADLAKTTLLAPYDGLVAAKTTDIGQFISTGSGIAETFAIDYAEVRLPIPENKIQYLDLPSHVRQSTGASNEDFYDAGLAVELSTQLGDREYHWSGKLTRTEGVLDSRTRVLFSVVQIKDPYNLYNNEHGEPLRIGTYVNADIQGQRLRDVMSIPRHTLLGNNVVWVADQENRLRARTVEVATINGNEAYIRSGLQDGDKVVLTRMENPLNNTLVEIAVSPSTSSLIN